ncbi:MAG: hypothetical protein HKN76_11725, partial [Saprospiraceae bacterium]|nr:hypothetical protein [Saprospiraceae bacterium]
MKHIYSAVGFMLSTLILSMIHTLDAQNVSTEEVKMVENTRHIVEQLEIDSVWVANKVSFDLHTVGNKQFVAYYDKNRMMTVASRELGSDQWQKKTLPSRLMWDSHNYVALGID